MEKEKNSLETKKRGNPEFTKGKSGNPNGRPKGTPNRITTDLRTWIGQLIDNNREQVIDDLKKLEPHQRVQIFERLMAYVVPKLQSVQAQIDINNLSEEQIDYIIVELSNRITDEN